MAEVILYSWEFGDDGKSQDESPSHRYNMPGVYTPKLTATLDDGRVIVITDTQTITDWSEVDGEVNGSYTNKHYQLAIKKSQGYSLSERTGDDLVVPEARSGTLKVFDALGQYIQLFLDANDLKWYHVSTRTGPSGGGITKIWGDKETITSFTILNVVLSSDNPVRVDTTAAHGLKTGFKVKFFSVGGTVELNNRIYTITVTDTVTFTLDGTDGDDYTAWTSGGTLIRSGAFPIPSLKRPEDRGAKEHYSLEDLETHIATSPIDESARNDSGFDSDGYPTATEITLTAYKNGNPDSDQVRALDANRLVETVFPRNIRGNRIQYEIAFNRPDIIFRQALHYYKVTDESADPDSASQTEGGYEDNIAQNLSVWLSRYKTPLLNLATGTLLTGTATQITGPDGKGKSAITISADVALGNVLMSSGMLVLWHKSGYTISGVSLTQYNTIGSWIMSTVSGYLPAALILGAGDVFDVRVFTTQLTSAELLYYYNNINDDEGNNVLPLW